MNTSIALPESLFQRLSDRAEARKISPEELAIEVLSAQLEPQHPYIELSRSAGGVRPVIRGTRTGVDAVIGYANAGYSAEEIANDMLPHLQLAEVYDALSYYADHRHSLDDWMAQNSPAAWQERLFLDLGEKDAKNLIGAA